MTEPSVRRVRVTYEGLVEDHGFYLRPDFGPNWKALIPTFSPNVSVEYLDERDHVAEQDELRKQVRG